MKDIITALKGHCPTPRPQGIILAVVTLPPAVQLEGGFHTPSLSLMRRPGLEATSRMASGTLQGPIKLVSMLSRSIGRCSCRQDGIHDDGLVVVIMG